VYEFNSDKLSIYLTVGGIGKSQIIVKNTNKTGHLFDKCCFEAENRKRKKAAAEKILPAAY
jgi:hypothetical protein